MSLLTQAQREQLLDNGREQHTANANEQFVDFEPVVKLFTPDAHATWLLTELYPADPDVAFGLCDLGLGFPELGDVRISELEALRGPFGLPVECDLHFEATKPISWYVNLASLHRTIIA